MTDQQEREKERERERQIERERDREREALFVLKTSEYVSEYIHIHTGNIYSVLILLSTTEMHKCMLQNKCLKIICRFQKKRCSNCGANNDVPLGLQSFK
jgi:hypothetical protein